MTLAAGTDGLSTQIEVSTLMFLVADGAGDAGDFVSLCVGRMEFFGLMAFDASILYRLVWRVSCRT